MTYSDNLAGFRAEAALFGYSSNIAIFWWLFFVRGLRWVGGGDDFENSPRFLDIETMAICRDER